MYVYAGLPTTDWSCDSSGCAEGSVGLWKIKNCTKGTNASSSFEDFGPLTDADPNCTITNIKPSLKDFQTVSLGERDGTVVGICFGVIFSMLSLATTACCKSRRWLVVSMPFLATVCGIVAVAMWIEFSVGSIDKDNVINIVSGKTKMGEGFILSCGGAVANFVALICAYMVKKFDKYEFIS
jgi:hypothetical protein